jgi:hypothetical protein
MAQGKRTSEETRAKVVELKMWNPELSSRDIAKELEGTEYEVSNDTVCDIINSLPHLATSIEWVEQIKRLDTIIWGIEAITSKLVNKLQLQEEISVNDVKQLNDIAKTNFDRRQLLSWKETSRVKVETVTIEI